MFGLEEFYKKHSLANILTVCIVVRIYADYFYLQIGKVFYEFTDYLPLIISCMFGWKAGLVALIAPIISNIYKTFIGESIIELVNILFIVITNMLLAYLSTKPFFKCDWKKLLLFEIGTIMIGCGIYFGRLAVDLSVTSPFSHFSSIFNLLFIMVMLILINAKQNREDIDDEDVKIEAETEAEAQVQVKHQVMPTARISNPELKEKAYDVLCNSYTKILRVDLTKDTFNIIHSINDELDASKGYSDSITIWLREFAKSGMVHKDDVEVYLKETNGAYLKKYFNRGMHSLSIHYRRRFNESYRQVKMELIRAEDYTESNQIVYLYVKDIE